jgi:hypothetical protein
MSLARLTKATALGCILGALLVATAAGNGALVKVNGIVLRADGSFQPRALPRDRFAPIDFRGYLDIAAKGGGKPVALQQAVIDFDRDGRLSVGGLPVCRPELVADVGPAKARRVCGGAIVGEGRVEALIDLGGGPVSASSPLTLFNGPPSAGHPTVVLHARTTVPVAQTYAIVVPIERRPGGFRYRATLEVPPIAAGLGAVTHIEVDVGRRFAAGGQRRSYVSARCSDGILRTHGRFSFADGTVVDGSVEKACTAR